MCMGVCVRDFVRHACDVDSVCDVLVRGVCVRCTSLCVMCIRVGVMWIGVGVMWIVYVMCDVNMRVCVRCVRAVCA